MRGDSRRGWNRWRVPRFAAYLGSLPEREGVDLVRQLAKDGSLPAGFATSVCGAVRDIARHGSAAVMQAAVAKLPRDLGRLLAVPSVSLTETLDLHRRFGAVTAADLAAVATLAGLELFFSTHYAPDIATEVAQKFIKGYEELYGYNPDDVAALTYDAFQLLYLAIETANSTDRAAVREALENIDLFEGVTGVTKFDEQGDPIKCAVIIEIKDGAFTYYDSACPAGFPPE